MDRRNFLHWAFAATGLSVVAKAHPYVLNHSPLFALGSNADLPDAIKILEGEVFINGERASPGAFNAHDANISIQEPDSAVGFTVGHNAFLLRGVSNLRVSSLGTKTKLSIQKGKLLSYVVRPDETASILELESKISQVTVRNTMMYMKVDSERDYICLCSGAIDIHTAHQKIEMNTECPQSVCNSHHAMIVDGTQARPSSQRHSYSDNKIVTRLLQ